MQTPPSEAMLTMATPRIVVDEAILRNNINRMAAAAHAAGLALRPHVKTHKSVQIGRWQMEAGAVGITVATVSEAEIFAASGFDDIFIAYPLWVDEFTATRLRALAARTRLTIGVGSAEDTQQLARLCPGTPIGVLIEIDSGHHRTGVPPEAASPVAQAAQAAGLELAGIFTFPGHGYAPVGLASAAADESTALATAKAAIESCGIAVRTVSGGSSPTVSLADAQVLTEVRPGAYVFNDTQQVLLGSCEAHDVALTIEATIVSVSASHAVANVGSKILSSDAPAWTDGYGRILDQPDARITALSEHHATIVGADLRLGQRIRLVPNHVCMPVNLVDWMAVVNGTLTYLSVDARGANY